MKKNTTVLIVGKTFDISLIGTGNLAWHLGPALENAGHRIREIYGRDLQNAKALQRRLYDADIQRHLDFSSSNSEVFIMAVRDEAIEKVAKAIALPAKAVLAHTSGSQPVEKLEFSATPNTGVFYPLQTFTKGKKVAFGDIPVLVESDNSYTGKVLMDIACSITKHCYDVFADDRIAIHLAAVFACNFTNYMLRISETILEKHHFDLELLRPLIAETLNKSLDLGPLAAQTGPARRGDLETLDRHIAFLDNQNYRDIYRMISQQILDLYHEE